MIGIGMPTAQARMPFMGMLLWLLRGDNVRGGGLVPGRGVGCAFIAHHWEWFERCAMNAHPTWRCTLGDRLTAGWARRCWFWALYGATSPGDVLLEMLQKRLPEGGEPEKPTVRWTVCPANARAHLRGPGDGRVQHRRSLTAG